MTKDEARHLTIQLRPGARFIDPHQHLRWKVYTVHTLSDRDPKWQANHTTNRAKVFTGTYL